MGFNRDRNNYPDLQIASYQDPNTMAVFPEAVYTSGLVSISSRQKILRYEIDVYASIDAFESGGNALGCALARNITMESTPSYDEVMAANANLVGGILVVLSALEHQIEEQEAETKSAAEKQAAEFAASQAAQLAEDMKRRHLED